MDVYLVHVCIFMIPNFSTVVQKFALLLIAFPKLEDVIKEIKKKSLIVCTVANVKASDQLNSYCTTDKKNHTSSDFQIYSSSHTLV